MASNRITRPTLKAKRRHLNVTVEAGVTRALVPGHPYVGDQDPGQYEGDQDPGQHGGDQDPDQYGGGQGQGQLIAGDPDLEHLYAGDHVLGRVHHLGEDAGFRDHLCVDIVRARGHGHLVEDRAAVVTGGEEEAQVCLILGLEHHRVGGNLYVFFNFELKLHIINFIATLTYA